MYKILGWTNVIIVLIMVSPYILVRLNRSFVKSKDTRILGIIKFLRRLHKPLGGLLIISALAHGYLALGFLRIHTGVVLFIVLLVTASLGAAFALLRKRHILKAHKIFAGLVFVMLAIHRLFPNAFS